MTCTSDAIRARRAFHKSRSATEGEDEEEGATLYVYISVLFSASTELDI